MTEQSTSIDVGSIIDLASEVIGLRRADGEARLMESMGGGPPVRLDGHTIALSMIDGPSPHDGECHPDGDEVLVMVSGRIDIHLELDTGVMTVHLGPGEALVVPKGVWHRIDLVEPGQLLNITPGPRGDYRPLVTG